MAIEEEVLDTKVDEEESKELPELESSDVILDSQKKNDHFNFEETN